MKIPEDAVIPEEKITRYLLVPRDRNDKSKYLAQVGFGLDHPEDLEVAIRRQIQEADATESRVNEYGTFYEVVGELVGPSGESLSVVTIWLRRQVDDVFQFVTLKPYRGD
jgi:ADP-ribose pyrophosphatase YjhB (NUDIX family)